MDQNNSTRWELDILALAGCATAWLGDALTEDDELERLDLSEFPMEADGRTRTLLVE